MVIYNDSENSPASLPLPEERGLICDTSNGSLYSSIIEVLNIKGSSIVSAT